MGKPILYGTAISPPVRAVQLTLNALALDHEYREVNLLAGEQLSEEFLKKNPQHTVPVLEDDGKVICDSHAIMTYLVRKYGKTDALYPKDFYQRAVVDQRLHFESGVLFPSLANISLPFFYRKETKIPQERLDAIREGYKFMEAFLQHDYLAGDHLTVADFSALAIITSLQVLAPYNPAETPKMVAWLNRLYKLPYYEKANGQGVKLYHSILRKGLNLK